jgi:hypothetical protein
VESNPTLVTRKESKNYPGLFVLKYHKRVFFDNLWHVSPWLLECRGLVVDTDYNIIVHPFTKIFNYGENGTRINRNEVVLAVEKINGFMAAVTLWNNKIIVSTTGSLDSDFVNLAKKYLPADDKPKAVLKNNHVDTLLFEICATEDPHIIMETPGAYLIGHRVLNNEHQISVFNQLTVEALNDHFAKLLDCFRPRYFTMSFDRCVAFAKICKTEGYVVYGNGNALKIKSPYYLGTKFLARMRDEKMIRAWQNGSIKQKLDEEFYDIIDQFDAKTFANYSEHDRIAAIREFFLKEQP